MKSVFYSNLLFLLITLSAYCGGSKAETKSTDPEIELYKNKIVDTDQNFILSISGTNKNEELIKDSFLVNCLPNPFKIEIGMPSRQVFNILGRATNSDATTIGIFLYRPNLSPLEAARKYFFRNDSDGKLLKAGAFWDLVEVDTKNNNFVFLSISVCFEKPWRILKQEEQEKTIYANPFIRGQDKGWRVQWYSIKKETEPISFHSKYYVHRGKDSSKEPTEDAKETDKAAKPESKVEKEKPQTK